MKLAHEYNYISNIRVPIKCFTAVVELYVNYIH